LLDRFILHRDRIHLRSNNRAAIGTKEIDAIERSSGMYFPVNVSVYNEFSDQLVTFWTFTTSHIYILVSGVVLWGTKKGTSIH
jgi:cytochrome b subunit of formate dehydrogenase